MRKYRLRIQACRFHTFYSTQANSYFSIRKALFCDFYPDQLHLAMLLNQWLHPKEKELTLSIRKLQSQVHQSLSANDCSQITRALWQQLHFDLSRISCCPLGMKVDQEDSILCLVILEFSQSMLFENYRNLLQFHEFH